MPGAFVETSEVALIVSRVHDIRIGRIRRDISRFPTTHGVPIGEIDRPLITAAGYSYCAVVLLRAIDVIGGSIVGNNMIKLRGWLIILTCPRLATIQGDRYTAIVGSNHAPRILGIYPQSMVVAVGYFDFVETAATVRRSVEVHIQNVDRLLILRIGNDVHVIPGALDKAVTPVNELPSLTAIVGTVKTTILRFDQGIHPLGVGGHS